ncbi:bifunctional 23S rRNA (guanine(2069)-N(7))-methyltransferase RlmK/23S rRNA (guanine(2445)-N(2))-methyltransferase RlmL [Psychrobacter sp. I-STPA6b]|uniref:bifunctional 23S rRNA (guanine(2069)-N(7))-methyltransferase RlmK/23S rRNA (guanine(2445)-N(2))-methyltransferase RlmL n=1 Tax=Psychrobacter sp. I-STPA6b TaxID=2585718 RepID=UPI001D0C6FC8|nr:bifunctional 23S rRNA (guanine(2069)-N(7))-methyltransferase RlmK/23S rRNA (guanine(2445)-N(2))-methyltransferase RlmL [Psychrobacter sp. I-STPA6b]
MQPSQQVFDIVVTCADGLEAPLQTELTTLGITSHISSTGRLSVSATLVQIYQICLWSRVASRVLLPIKRRNINTEYDVAEQLYTLAKGVDWTAWFNLDNTFAIRVSVDKRVSVSQQFAMLRIKDAIADTFNDKYDARPDVDSRQPEFSIYAAVGDKQAELYLDLSGTSLHRRGYRVAMTDAPLKENLAAALLYSVGWHEQGRYDALIDPMCGSGTFLIEALLMSCDYAVGLDKAEGQFGFYHWQHHNSELWQQLITEAQSRFHNALERFADDTNLPTIIGYDADAGAIKATHKNLIAAGLQPIISQVMLQQRPLNQLKSGLQQWQSKQALNTPLIITNPPYGERLGDEDMIKPLYQGLGLILQDTFAQAKQAPTLGLLAAHVEQADVLPIAKPQTLRCHNGAITVYFRYGRLITDSTVALIDSFEKKEISVEAGQDFVNRLQKNVAKLKKQASKQNITNLRLYDADLPDFKVAIDVYGDNVHVQEYAPPKSIPPETAKKRFNLALLGIREVFGIDREQVFIKTRARQSGKEQYTKQGGEKQGKFYIVKEDDAYFYVNFTDYLDTGLFIDHRNMRQLIKAASAGKCVLNLFAYTCTASVHAALAGAKSVTSVDLSQNYLDWGRRNFALNGLDISASKYEFIAADTFEWIKDNTEQFDTIFIDPPTFSNSKKFQGTFDVQRDHAALINRAMNRLATGGILYFSNNFTKFELDESLRQRYDVTDITHKTIGFDFNIKKPIHQSFEIRHK